MMQKIANHFTQLYTPASPLEQGEEHERAVAELDDAGWAVVPVDSRTSIDSAWQNLLQTARTAAL